MIAFLDPVITAASGQEGGGLALLLWLFGLAAVVANLIGGAAADRAVPPRPSLG